MTDQLENLAAKEPRDMGQSIRDFTREALAALNERREKEYAEACECLNEELSVLAVESADLEAKNQVTTERLASTERVLRFELDQLVMRGESTEAKLAELAEVKAGAEKVEKRRREIAARREQIQNEKRDALRRGAEEFREASILLIRGAESGLASILDATRDSLNNLEAQLGESVYRVDQLTAAQESSEWRTLTRCYRGRG
ncbi:MAG TPA: hypothetical protein VJY15_03105 [Candidatus Acidoferrum sp.]|nr:hypothetical protein [Candidatus Acidoferrum sp.]